MIRREDPRRIDVGGSRGSRIKDPGYPNELASFGDIHPVRRRIAAWVGCDRWRVEEQPLWCTRSLARQQFRLFVIVCKLARKLTVFFLLSLILVSFSRHVQLPSALAAIIYVPLHRNYLTPHQQPVSLED